MVTRTTKAVGSRAEVMHGTAHHTAGGLVKCDLKYNRWGKIVSRRKSALGKRLYRENKDILQDYEFEPGCGRRRRRRRRRSSCRRRSYRRRY